MQVLVTGASGFVGSRLVEALTNAGHEVRAMTRQPADYRGAGTAVFGDVEDASSLDEAVEGCDAAYYLVHSLDHADFVERDRDGAHAFGAAARSAGVKQIVYLGGLGDDRDDLSDHLSSRREVEQILCAYVPTTTLRAGIVVGDGGTSWEILRQLVQRLPVMVTPRWVQTRTQPIAIDDVVAFLVAVLGNEETFNQSFDVGGPRVLTYAEMLGTVGRMPGGILRAIVPVPLLTPQLSSHWLRLIANVDFATARALVDSMSNEVVVRDRRIEEITGHRAMEFEQAAELALAEREKRLG